MAKKGMSRPEWTHTQPQNDVPPVPELQGRAKHSKEMPPPPAGAAFLLRVGIVSNYTGPLSAASSLSRSSPIRSRPPAS